MATEIEAVMIPKKITNIEAIHLQKLDLILGQPSAAEPGARPRRLHVGCLTTAWGRRGHWTRWLFPVPPERTPFVGKDICCRLGN